MKYSMAHLIDSSVWIALFLDFDTQHKKAVLFFDDLRGNIYIPYCVVNETTTILAYKHSKQQADNFLTYVEHNSAVTLISDNAEEEIVYYKSLTNKISFTDAALLLLSQKLGAELVTFDKQLARVAKGAKSL